MVLKIIRIYCDSYRKRPSNIIISKKKVLKEELGALFFDIITLTFEKISPGGYNEEKWGLC